MTVRSWLWGLVRRSEIEYPAERPVGDRDAERGRVEARQDRLRRRLRVLKSKS